MLPARIAEGGNTESIFENAPRGTIEHAIWRDQLRKHEKFRGMDDKLFKDFSDDPKGVMLASSYRIIQHMAENPHACQLVMKKVIFF